MMLILIAWPIAEIQVLLRVARMIGFPMVLMLLVLAALIGSALIRRPGFGVAARARRSWSQGVLPARQMFDALCLFGAGFLFLIPGFISDGVAILLLLPPFRTILFAWAASRLIARVRVYGAAGSSQSEDRPDGIGRTRPSGDVVIDADWEEVTTHDAPDDAQQRLGPSGEIDEN